MFAKVQETWGDIRSSWWFVPLMMATAAILLAFVTTLLDARFGDVFASGFGLYAGGVEGTRAVLETIATSLITVAGVAFSVAIVVMTLASSQFGPRVLRTFMRDPGNQVTLGTFVATYLFCLLVLRTVRSEDSGGEEFIPALSVTVALLLTIASLAVFIYFIHHSARSIQASHIIGAIGSQLEGMVESLFPSQLGQPATGEQERPLQGEGHLVRARDTGYVQLISSRSLLKPAAKHDLVIELLAAPGDFVVGGSPIARVRPAERVDEETSKDIRGAFAIGTERSDQQDISFMFDQLQQMCLRALSPAMNDPITASQCLDRMAAGLALLAQADAPSGARADEDGRLRVLARPVSMAELLERSFSEIRRSGRDSLPASQRYLRALALVGAVATRADDLSALREECRRVVDEASPELSATDVATLREELRRALSLIDALEDQPPTVRP